MGIGGGLTYTGQTVIIEGETLRQLAARLHLVQSRPLRRRGALPPYSLTLDEFDVTYQPLGQAGAGQAGDFAAHLTTQEPGEDAVDGVVRVNHPLDMAGDRVYLMGNGYAPTHHDPRRGRRRRLQESVPFLPQDTNMTSLGVVKIPDGLAEQLGLVGFFYPTAGAAHVRAR